MALESKPQPSKLCGGRDPLAMQAQPANLPRLGPAIPTSQDYCEASARGNLWLTAQCFLGARADANPFSHFISSFTEKEQTQKEKVVFRSHRASEGQTGDRTQCDSRAHNLESDGYGNFLCQSQT